MNLSPKALVGMALFMQGFMVAALTSAGVSCDNATLIAQEGMNKAFENALDTTKRHGID